MKITIQVDTSFVAKAAELSVSPEQLALMACSAYEESLNDPVHLTLAIAHAGTGNMNVDSIVERSMHFITEALGKGLDYAYTKVHRPELVDMHKLTTSLNAAFASDPRTSEAAKKLRLRLAMSQGRMVMDPITGSMVHDHTRKLSIRFIPKLCHAHAGHLTDEVGA